MIIPSCDNILLTLNSTNDDAALRAKVDEAMNVYDEYVKNRGEGGEPSLEGVSAQPNGTENQQPAAEEEAAKEA